MPENNYFTGLSILFWLLWVVGLLVLLLFGFFTLATATTANAVAAWNGLVVLVEGFLLFKTAWHFVCKERPMPNLLLWIAMAALAVPFIAFGGCFMLESMSFGLNIGR